MNIKLASASVPHRLRFFTVVSICISQMINDVDHLFKYLSAICMSYFGKCLFRPSAHILIRLFFFCYWTVWVLCIFSILTSYQIWFVIIFSHLLGCLFILLVFFLNYCTEALMFGIVICLFFFCYFCFWIIFKISLPGPVSWRSLPTFSSGRLMVSSLAFKCLIHLVNLGVWYKIVAQFHPLAYSCPAFPMPFFEETLLSPLCIFCLFVIN